MLRGLRADDRAAFDSMHAGPNFHRFLGRHRRSPSENWIRALAWTGLWAVEGMGSWAVEDADGFVGNVVLGHLPRELNPPLGRPEAGWVFAETAWGRGYASEAVGAMLAWADGQAIERTCCIIEPANAASIRVAEKHGFAFDRTADMDGPINIYYRARGG